MKNNHTPEIRFAGFTGDWEQRKLSEISEKVTEKNKNNIYSETLTNSAEFGIINQRDFFDKDISNEKNLDGYYVVRPDDFVYNPRISNFAPVGPIKRNKLGRTGVMSPLYYVFRPHDVDKTYLEIYFSSTSWHKFMKMNGDSGARSDRFAIKDSLFCEMPIPIPSIEEQTKISNCFKQLDETIALHQQELTALKQTKQGFLQKMFPKEGESVPEVRFSGFTGDWEQCKLGDIYDVVSGFAFKMSDYVQVGVPIINGESIQHGSISTKNLNYLPEEFLEKYQNYILDTGDIVLGLNRPITNGNLKIAQVSKDLHGALLYQRAGKIIVLNNSDINFSYQLLGNEVSKFVLKEAVGSDQPFISTTKLKKWLIRVPVLGEEQTKIGLFFKNLDETIALHQRELEALKETKKAFLQKMFA